jgi:hypothetical protein
MQQLLRLGFDSDEIAKLLILEYHDVHKQGTLVAVFQMQMELIENQQKNRELLSTVRNLQAKLSEKAEEIASLKQQVLVKKESNSTPVTPREGVVEEPKQPTSPPSMLTQPLKRRSGTLTGASLVTSPIEDIDGILSTKELSAFVTAMLNSKNHGFLNLNSNQKFDFMVNAASASEIFDLESLPVILRASGTDNYISNGKLTERANASVFKVKITRKGTGKVKNGIRTGDQVCIQLFSNPELCSLNPRGMLQTGEPIIFSLWVTH